MVVAPKVQFNNGVSCPIVGLGTWKAKGVAAKDAVKAAIDAGYRHIDGAYVYGNEVEIGQAIKEKIQKGAVKRQDLFITNKLWNTYHRKDAVVQACKKSLANMGLDYFDLYLIHWPTGFKEGDDLSPTDASGKVIYSDYNYVDTWKGMEDCYRQGLAKSIGVSNFNHKQIEDVLRVAQIKPVNNQVECHPLLNQEKLIAFCKKNNITVTAYSPLGSPGRDSVGSQGRILDNPTVVEMAKRYKKTPAQILIRFQVERGVIVIPKSANKSRIEENLNVFDFSISSEDMKRLNEINSNTRLIDWLQDHKYYPFKLDY